MGKRKPTARTVHKRLWEEAQLSYVTLREFAIYGSLVSPLSIHGKRVGDLLAKIRDDPEIVEDENFLFEATQIIADGERRRERVLKRTAMRMEQEGYEIRGE